MKNKLLYLILLLEALVCLWLGTIPQIFMENFTHILAFPFEQIGNGLRSLSLSGSMGNAVAILLYIIVSLLPLAFLLVRKPFKFYPEDTLIALSCLSLFFVLYQMINPGDIAIGGGFAQGLDMAKAVLGGTLYSVLVGYLILHMLRVFFIKGQANLLRRLYTLLFLLNMLFVLKIFGVGCGELVSAIASVAVTNSGNARLFNINYLFIFLRFAIDYLPYILNIVIVFYSMSLLKNMACDRYSNVTVICAQKLSRVCVISLSLAVSCPIAFNILQLLFAKVLFNVNSSVQVPLFSVIFLLVCLVFTRLVTESKEIKDDNDSII